MSSLRAGIGSPVPGPAVAAYDCGTNSTRLLVVGAGGRTLDRQMRITRLGEGVDRSGALSPQAISRTLSVLEDYKARADELGVQRARLVATSAARNATNAEEFFDAAAKVTGLEPELLSGEEEGRLSFAGATAHLPAGFGIGQWVLVVDIGGGSTELVLGLPSDPASARAVSVEVGCVRVTERFFGHDPPEPSELSAASGAVRRLLDPVGRYFSDPESGPCMIGLAGTVSTLAALERSLVSYDRDRIHHTVLTRACVDRWLSVLAAEESARRLARSGVMRGRQDVIVGGALILSCVMSVFSKQSCLVSEDDILDGLAAGLAESG